MARNTHDAQYVLSAKTRWSVANLIHRLNGWFYNDIMTLDFEYAPYELPCHGLQA